ncbi:hypothetical protein CKO23_00595 [Thiocystis violacea]|nr:hypothetical protein [Thiocystis violacea]
MIPEILAAHPDWHLVRVAEASAAFQLLAQYSVGVLVASFGTDRAGCEQFFKEAKARDRAVMRMGLISPCVDKSSLKPLDEAHQCYAIDVSAAQLGDAIERALSLRERAQRNPRLRDLLAELNRLPTPPAVYFDIRDALHRPQGSLKSIVPLLSKDPALTAKVLKVANSGYYALPRTIADLQTAITLLGQDTLLAIVLAAHLFDRLPLPGLNLDKLWIHAVAIAVLSKRLAEQEGLAPSVASACGVAGLLHDVGQLILLVNMPTEYYGAIREAAGDEERLLLIERERFGVGHPELGGYLLALWGLPDAVVQAVAEHHECDDERIRLRPFSERVVGVAEWLLQRYRTQTDAARSLGCPNCLTDQEASRMGDWWSSLDALVEQRVIG